MGLQRAGCASTQLHGGRLVCPCWYHLQPRVLSADFYFCTLQIVRSMHILVDHAVREASHTRMGSQSLECDICRSGRDPRWRPQQRSASLWRTSCWSASLSWSPCCCSPPLQTSRHLGGGPSLVTPAMAPAGLTAWVSAGRPALPTSGQHLQSQRVHHRTNQKVQHVS